MKDVEDLFRLLNDNKLLTKYLIYMTTKYKKMEDREFRNKMRLFKAIAKFQKNSWNEARINIVEACIKALESKYNHRKDK